MATPRLDSEERRKGIVDAALPLFARKGFSGTTTREIAAAAGVSEALLFKHFPSKAALYQEIILLGCEGHPAMEQVDQLAPSVESLIGMVGLMVRHFVLCPRGSPDDFRYRLLVMSFLEDGEYARLVFDWAAGRVYPKFAACLDAARQEGLVAETAISAMSRFQFGHYVAIMLNCLRMPEPSAIPGGGDPELLIADATQFILRGIGLKDEVIARYRPAALTAALEKE